MNLPVTLNLEANKLRNEVCEAYSSVATEPGDDHPFPVGRGFALAVGYPEALLDTLPAPCVDAFAGVSNISIFADIPEGSSVLDLGCGAGLDSLIAMNRTGARGEVIGLDFSEAMLNRANEGRRLSGSRNTMFCRADAERLPLRDASVDVAMVNGIFNLNPARQEIFGELSRVVKKCGKVFAAELILLHPLSPAEQSKSHWFA
jgi:arsenite methyltransferase